MFKLRRIDTHAHVISPAYRNWLVEKGVDSGGLPIPTWSVEAALEAMDENSIETAILSVSTPGVEPGELQEARYMAREVNEFAAKVVADRPNRFGFFATLTLPDVDGALAEAEYAFDTLHADGVVVHAHSHNMYLGDQKFDPLIDELNQRKAVIFVHPSELLGNSIANIPAFVADFLLDTVRAAINLSRSGTMDRCPDIKVLLSHAGGFLPYAAERIAPFASPKRSSKDGLRLLQRFYLDTAVASSRFSLPSLLAFAEPSRITYGSDFPYAPPTASRLYTAQLDAYEPANHLAINRGNAELLFPRLRAV